MTPRPPSSSGGSDRLDDQHPAAKRVERWYIGRRHVADPHGDPLVIDWRAEMSTAFYRATRTDPMGVALRRRFGLERGEITAFEDEHLLDRTEPDAKSQILVEEIERPRIGPMRDIVATIQPEQDGIVRADAATTVCVQGAPGTGKTAVGLHRAAWLLYAFRERLSRSGVLVIGPNRAFLDHIGAVLPALGEVQVRHTTIDDLVAGRPLRGSDPTETAVLKGDPRLAEVLRRAVWSQVRTATEPLVVPRGVRKWRVPAYQVNDILEELRGRGVRYDAARAMLPQRLAHAVLLQMEQTGDSPDDRVQDAVARSAPVKRYAGELWPAVDAREVLFRLLADPEELAVHAEGLLDDGERQRLLWSNPSKNKGSVRWSRADAVLLDELSDIVDRTPSLGHIVLDEAQDLSPMQLRTVGRRCSTGAATVLGDIAQGTWCQPVTGERQSRRWSTWSGATWPSPARSGSSPPTARSPDCRRRSTTPASRTAPWAPTTATSSTRSTSSRRPWPRAWSSTGSWCWSRPRSRRPSRTPGPDSAGSTSC
jgi:hypothetical protein